MVLAFYSSATTSAQCVFWAKKQDPSDRWKNYRCCVMLAWYIINLLLHPIRGTRYCFFYLTFSFSLLASSLSYFIFPVPMFECLRKCSRFLPLFRLNTEFAILNLLNWYWILGTCFFFSSGIILVLVRECYCMKQDNRLHYVPTLLSNFFSSS